MWVMIRLALLFLFITLVETMSKKIRFIKFTEKLDSVDESVNLLPESVKPANLKCYILKISSEVIGVTTPVQLD